MYEKNKQKCTFYFRLQYDPLVHVPEDAPFISEPLWTTIEVPALDVGAVCRSLPTQGFKNQ